MKMVKDNIAMCFYDKILVNMAAYIILQRIISKYNIIKIQ